MQNSKHKKRYSKISVEKRIKLVGLVLEEGITITKAAKMLHVKRPTAKIIIKRYQRSGTFFQKKMPAIKAKNTNLLGENSKVEEVSIEGALQQRHDSSDIKIQEKDAQCHETMTQLCTQGQIGLVFFYQPYFDYQCFM